MYYTDNHSILKSTDGKEDVELIPFKEFEAFKGNYKVTSFARIKLSSDHSIAYDLQAGMEINGIGTVKRRRAKPKTSLLEE